MHIHSNLAATLAAVLLTAAACTPVAEESLMDEDGVVTLNSQSRVASFKADKVDVLVISGDDITDLSGLDVREAGVLSIRKVSATEISLPRLQTVSGTLAIENNSKLTAVKDLSGLKRAGAVIINNNPRLTDIGALKDVARIEGDLTVTNNLALGEDKPEAEAGDWRYGLFPVRYLSDHDAVGGKIILDNNHFAAATSVDRIGNLDVEEVFPDYSFSSAAEVEAAGNIATIARHVTFRGSEIGNDQLAAVLAKGLREIRGTFTLEDTRVTNLNRFCQSIPCHSVVLRNNSETIDLDGVRYYGAIDGDMIIDHSRVHFWRSGSSLTTAVSVGGDLRIIGCSSLQTGASLESLLRVGGDFEISDCSNVETLAGMPLETIGGNLIIRDNAKLASLGGLEAVNNIGGHIEIQANLPEYGDIGTPGWCMVKNWLSSGVVKDADASTVGILGGGEIPWYEDIKPCSGDNPQAANVAESYTLTSRGDIDEFLQRIPDRPETVFNLTVSGSDISDADLAGLSRRIGAISGRLTLQDLPQMTTTSGIMDKISCTGGITLKNLPALVGAEGLRGVTSLLTDLIVEGCPKLETPACGKDTGWKNLGSVGGSIRIRGIKTAMDGCLFPALGTVGGTLELDNLDDSLTDFAGMAVSTIGGDLVITGNAGLRSLEGLDNLMAIGGNVVIRNNPLLTVTPASGVGYCLIRDYLSWSVIPAGSTITLGTDSAPVDVESLPSCDPEAAGKPRSYVINGLTALRTFIANRPATGKETVFNLTVKGGDITEEAFRSLDDRVGVVQGTFTMEELGVEGGQISTDQVIENIDLQGSVILRNIAATINPNGFQSKTVIHGDLVLESCPHFPYWNWDPFKNLRTIEGDLVVTGMPNFGAPTLSALEKVGGNFYVHDQSGFWHFDSKTLKEIGGDLRIINCKAFGEDVAFRGFDHMENIGGDVVITGISQWMIITAAERAGAKGLCMLKWYKDNGIIKGSVTVDFTHSSQGHITFEDLPSCKPE